MTEIQKGKIGVTTENIFPIIKKYLYSDHEIFLRELISNAVDATQKMKTLSSIGEFKGELGDLSINVSLDKEAKTLTISDRGVGMSAEEVDKYINQIAFSGAEEFMKKYQDKKIIGHFGLGFYSSFMVSDKVEIRSQSHDESAPTVVWSCDGTPEFTITESDEKRERGTDIILNIAEDSVEFLEKERVEGLLKKYCRFLPVPIIFGKKQEWKDGNYVDTDEDNVVNDTDPIWAHMPTEITDEQYSEFYHKLYPGSDEPLFNIHLNIDYPFNLTGILYFPKIRNNIEIQKNKIQLYSNQVYVTDSVEGIVPEFLTLLHGVIDSPDIPLNVSRSYLQSDSNVRKISSYITRKVADRLQEIFNESRDEFEEKWDDLKVFIEYGIVTEEKFAERAEKFFLLKNTEGKYFTFDEYKELIKGDQTDKNDTLVYLYTDDEESKFSFVESAKNRGYDVLLMDGSLDNHFINWFEQKNEGTSFARVDSNVIDKLIEKDKPLSMSLTTGQQEILRPVFQTQLPTKDEKVHYNISFEALDSKDTPVTITQDEYMRRMKDMAEMGGGGMAQMYGQLPDSYNIVVNGNHPLVIDILEGVEGELGDDFKKAVNKIEQLKSQKSALSKVIDEKDNEESSDSDKAKLKELSDEIGSLTKDKNSKLSELGAKNSLVKQLVDLALLSQGMLKGEELNTFIQRSVSLIGKE